jgi:hypothetical protein
MAHAVIKASLVVLLLEACGPQHRDATDGRPLSKLVEETSIRQRQLEIDRLAYSCRPRDIARLLTIAADNTMISTKDWSNQRCAALSALWVHHPIPHHWNAAVIHRAAAILEQSDVRAAIVKMLADDVPSCTKSVGGEDLPLSPQLVATELLIDFPVPELRADLDKAVARDEIAHRESHAQGALSILNIDRDYHEGPRATQLDEMVAAGTPEAFDHFIEFIADGMPWNDGRPAASADEAKEIHQHVQDAFMWLHMLASPPRPEIDHGWHWDCEVDIRRALIDGDLGQHLMEKFERLDAETRSLMLEVLVTTKPKGFTEWLARIAKEDPDPEIRQWAAPDPLERLVPHDAGIDGR